MPPGTPLGQLAGAGLGLASGTDASPHLASALGRAGLAVRQYRLGGAFGTVWLTVAERAVDAVPGPA